MASGDDLRPWERQDGESEAAYEAFKGYVYQTPPRRLAHASVKHGTAELSELYNEWRWKERALAWDRHCQRIRDDEKEELLKQDEKGRLAKMVAALETVGEILSREMAKLLRDSLVTEGGGLVKPSELNKLMNTWMTMQRLIHGESTENVVVSDARLENLSPDELREYLRLHAKLEAGTGDDAEKVH